MARADMEPKAVLFDLDGTLYDQRPLRRSMLVQLAKSPFSGPFRALRTARRLSAFRKERELLRPLGDSAPSLERMQYERPAERLGIEPDDLEATVLDWMHRRPLRFLENSAWPGLRSTLETLQESGLALGVFSDYPPEAKLEAMGVRDLFEVVLAATDADVNAFKPHPKGFLIGAEKLGHAPAEVVYVGDRADVDAAGAAAAGMPCLLLGIGAHANELPAGGDVAFSVVPTFREIPHALGLV